MIPGEIYLCLDEILLLSPRNQERRENAITELLELESTSASPGWLVNTHCRAPPPGCDSVGLGGEGGTRNNLHF